MSWKITFLATTPRGVPDPTSPTMPPPMVPVSALEAPLIAIFDLRLASPHRGCDSHRVRTATDGRWIGPEAPLMTIFDWRSGFTPFGLRLMWRPWRSFHAP